MELHGIRAARAELSTLVRRAGRGERIVISVDGRPLAQLGPVETTTAVTVDGLVACGLLDPPSRRRRPPVPDAAMLPVDGDIDTVLDDVRGR